MTEEYKTWVLGPPWWLSDKSWPANAETEVQSPIREDPTHWRATKLMSHKYWACALQSKFRNKEKPKRWEARTATKTQDNQKLMKLKKKKKSAEIKIE